MIHNITIQNFQSHKNTSLDLHSGVNAIVGESDAGKSAILRALNWIINNKPSGDSFRSHWCNKDDFTSVQLTINDSQINRIRDNKRNCYEFNSVEYHALGHNVPEAIEHVLNFKPINFQYQMSPPFLLSSTAGEVARYLNEIVNLSIIDSSFLNLKRCALEETTDQTRTKKEIENLQEELLQFENLDSYFAELKSIEDIETRLDSIIEEESKLTQILTNLIISLNKLNSIPNISKESIQELENLQKELNSIEQQESQLSTILINLQDTHNKLKNVSNIPKNAIQELESMVNGKEQIQKNYGTLEILIASLNSFSIKIEKANKQLKGYEKEYHSLTKDKCPLCGK